MEKIYFKNDYEGGTPIPKAIYWYLLEIGYKEKVNADVCNKLLNNELKYFFEKYPNELTNAVRITNIFNFSTNITEEDINFYKKEIKISRR